MSLTQRERDRVITVLDSAEDAVVQLILSGIESFTKWLAKELPGIFQKLGEEICRLWNWLKEKLA